MIGYEWDFPPLRSTGTLASFNPLTCFISADPLSREVERLRIASGALVPGLERNAAYYHELFHWVQFQATTFGQFLLSLRHARDQLIFDAILRDPSFRATVFDRSRTSWLAHFEEGAVSSAEFSEGTRTALSHFRDFEVVRRLFLFPDMVGFTAYPFAAATERALSAVSTMEHRRQTASNNARSKDGDFRVVSADVLDFETTSEAVLELSALTMEWMMHLTAQEIDGELLAHMISRLETALKEERQSSLRFVAEMLIDQIVDMTRSCDGTSLYDSLARIAVACDVALNPPLPPVIAPSGEMSLDQLLPSSRFVTIVNTCNLSGEDAAFELSKDAVLQYRDLICEMSGLSYGATVGGKLGAFPPTPDTLELPSYHWLFLRGSSDRFFGLRQQFPELLPFFGPLFSGYRAEEFVDAIELAKGKWFLPPVAECPDGLRPWADALVAKAFVQSIACDFSLCDLVTRSGLLTLPWFPESSRDDLITMTKGWHERLNEHCRREHEDGV